MLLDVQACRPRISQVFFLLALALGSPLVAPQTNASRSNDIARALYSKRLKSCAPPLSLWPVVWHQHALDVLQQHTTNNLTHTDESKCTTHLQIALDAAQQRSLQNLWLSAEPQHWPQHEPRLKWRYNRFE